MFDHDILRTPQFVQAAGSIQRRAEKQTDFDRLERVYVPNDALVRSGSVDSQLILGRRGTGKTHLMRVFEGMRLRAGDRVYYVDCTRLGSGFPSMECTAEELAKRYFVALLNELSSQLLDTASRMEAPHPAVQDRVLGHITYGLGGWVSPNSDLQHPTFNYRQITDALERILFDLQINRLFIVLDEWAQIPLSVQPYVANYIKHALLPVPAISLKIIAVTHQTRLSQMTGAGDIVGLQRGADLPDVIDMDVYLVFDKNTEERMVGFFGQVLYNHLGIEMEWPLDIDQESKVLAILRLFTQRRAFVELVRAAEGNCRDFLCIFGQAYFVGYRQMGGAAAISIPHVRTGAASWFRNEKEAHVRSEPELRTTLDHILNYVVKPHDSRTFMVSEAKSNHPRLEKLLSERVIHRLNVEYSHPSRPGERFAVFTIDNGAYVASKGPLHDPKQNVTLSKDDIAKLTQDEANLVVPFDNYTFIRRIIFDPDNMTVQADVEDDSKAGPVQAKFNF